MAVQRTDYEINVSFILGPATVVESAKSRLFGELLECPAFSEDRRKRAVGDQGQCDDLRKVSFHFDFSECDENL